MLAEQMQNPIFFEQNRVNRVYTGGALFADFFGDDSVDGFQPEEWVASNVGALNKNPAGPKEGVSRVRGTDIYFDDLLRDHAGALLGDRKHFGVLTKILDSAIRLPVQAHPDKEFSRKHFHSDFGKTEAWLVLATRPDACLYFGFREEITQEIFSKAVEDSRTQKDALSKLLHRVPVEPGEVFLIPARLVHAIGYGCLILEIQEPTDFTIQPEYWCGDYLLNDHEMYLGLDKETALAVFDYSAVGQRIMDQVRKTPRVLEKSATCLTECLISAQDTPCFCVERRTLRGGEAALTQAPAVCVITDGSGELLCRGNRWQVRKGDYFFLPWAAKDNASMTTDGRLQWVTCLPPV